MLKLPDLAEKIFVTICLFLSTSGLVPVLLDSENAAGIPADPYSPIFFSSIYLVTLLLILARRRAFSYVVVKDVWIWLLVGLALASILWTVAPDMTPRRSLLLLGTTLFGIYLATRYSLREQLYLLAGTLSIVIFLSIIFAIALPSYGVMSVQESGVHAGAWRGIMTHKNGLGRLMVLSNMVFLLLSISSRQWRWFFGVNYILSIALIVLSTSKTALTVFLTMTIMLPIYRAWRQNSSRVVPLTIAIILVAAGATTLLLDNLEVLGNVLGKDLTLSGRTDIWAIMWELIEQRPLLGYGFNGFWRGWDSEVSAYIWRTLEWDCPYGHNGFLDLMAELGVVGLGLFIMSLTTAYLRGVRWLRLTRSIEGVWPLMCLTFLVLYNLSEGSLLATNSIFWILYVSTIFSTAVEYDVAKSDSLHFTVQTEEWLEAAQE
ncbi:MAG: O-antigen ligase family protein [Nostocaceae cyanobacterium]|nr:O-antigen ligase family protein [Nostocaceae cyanobacterium]